MARYLHLHGVQHPIPTSSNSSAYARDAVRGRSWGRPEASIEDPTLGESLLLALEHLDSLC